MVLVVNGDKGRLNFFECHREGMGRISERHKGRKNVAKPIATKGMNLS